MSPTAPPAIAQKMGGQNYLNAMVSSRTAIAVKPTDPGRSRTFLQEQMQRLLKALKRDYPQLAIHEEQGISTFSSDGVTLRVANACEQGLLVVEVIDLRMAERWDCYYLRLEDGTFRTGWHRSAPGAASEPDAWLAGVADLVIDREIEPHVDPDFISLVAAMSSAAPITIAQSDTPLLRDLQEEVAQLRQQGAIQAAKLRALATAQSRVTDLVEAPLAPRTWQLDELDEWAADNADRITILPRAIYAAKKSVYEQPQLVYAALEMLASTYRLVKLGLQERTDLINEARSLGLDIGGSVDPSRANKDYFVRWGKNKRMLDQHLSRGVSRDTRLCMRIYYFWCEETERVVVGWLPSHLDNGLT